MAEQARRGGPLHGIRVIDLTQVVLGPFATQVLGDMGADVIKVETPAGDSTRQIGPCRSAAMGSYYANLNRNKRSIALDLKRPAAKAALWRLIEGADVFVHNMRPGAIARLGLDYAAVAARNPAIVYASAGGFGADTSRRDSPAYDDLIQGMSGLAALNAGPDGAPRYVPSVIADKLCGHVLASMTAMALVHRARTGEGQEVHVPMLETMLDFLLPEHFWAATIAEPARGMGYPRMLTPHRRPYATADGYICVIAVSDQQWQRIFAVLGRPDLAADPRFASVAARARHVDELYGLLAEGLRARPTAEWRSLLDAADVPNGAVGTLAGLLDDSYLRESGYFQPTEHPDEGAVIARRAPARFSATPPAPPGLWPKLGADGAAVLAEAGYAAEEIAAILAP
ncbi:MAG: CoA transferase [Rhodospirillales bacterium]|nr:CoA transferase [Rhodospirillales bacterium]